MMTAPEITTIPKLMNVPQDILIVQADYHQPAHAHAILSLLDEYARDPMGGGQGLNDEVKRNLLSRLRKIPDAFSILAWVNQQPAGLVNCFQGFSTFKCRPLINIHDVMVRQPFRGRKISRMMLQEVERIARQRGCCKLTLEVLEGNHAARRVYQSFGFAHYQLDPEMGTALFWEKTLD